MNHELETILDKIGLEKLVDTLSTICHEKSAHVMENYGEFNLSRHWTRAGFRLDTISRNSHVKAVSNPYRN